MSIPGFSGSTGFTEPTQVTEVVVPPRTEWRFECPFKLIMKVTIKDGVGEIFGTELPNEVEIRLTGCKYAIYAPLASGCRIQYEVVPNKDEFNISNEDSAISQYVSDDSPSVQYTNLHFALEVMRHEAEVDHTKYGPRVLILGNSQSGKTALAKTLASYAVKMDRVPLFVNLDPKEGVFSVPGSLTSTPISDSFDLESVGGWGGSTTSGATSHNPKQPLVKSYGFYEFSENVDLYKHQISQLGIAALSRTAQDEQIRAGGIIVDTPRLSMKDVNVIENIVSDFEINIIVVTGSDRLTVDLKRKFAHKISRQTLDVIKVARNSAVAEVDESFMRKIQEDTIKEYFNGNYKTRLSPYKTDVDMKNYTIYKAVKLSEYASQMAFLPSGDSYTAEEGGESEEKKEENSLDKFLVRLEEPNSSNLEHSILAITSAAVPSNGKIVPRELLNASVLGYAHVSKVDDTKNRMSLLLPFPGQIPRNVLIATSIGYTE
ncbi:hypothetical protein JCM33374_g3415 [Metschnikowia sp. JCM 33374]|nr:hypothetical protein JCM33374_g3415 [Metschnikowia sp. JCM 33374]